jgi:hypothetical protein
VRKCGIIEVIHAFLLAMQGRYKPEYKTSDGQISFTIFVKALAVTEQNQIASIFNKLYSL